MAIHKILCYKYAPHTIKNTFARVAKTLVRNKQINGLLIEGGAPLTRIF